MNIQKLELLTVNLQAQKDFYSKILELPAKLAFGGSEVQAGTTEILFHTGTIRF